MKVSGARSKPQETRKDQEMPTLKLYTKHKHSGSRIVLSGALNLRQDEYERLCNGQRKYEEGNGPDRGVFTHITEDGLPAKRLIVYSAIAPISDSIPT
jgi:hypothetical protein